MPDAPRILILGSVSLDHPAEPGGPIRLGGVPTYGGIALARTALVERFGWREVVVTAGARGGTVWAVERRFPYDAVPVAGPVDPTGAGDVFFAAYLAARLAGGEAVPAAARAAAAVAARHVVGGYVVAEAVGGGAPVG